MYQNTINQIEGLAKNTLTITEVTYNSVMELARTLAAQIPYFISGIIVILLFWGLAMIGKVIFLKTTERTGLDDRLRILFSRLLVVTIFVLGLFTALTIIIPNFTFGNLIAGLGFTSFIVGFATKDILNNLLSGVLILWQQPFKVGDNVSVKGNQGDVEFIGVRATRLKMDDGERVLMPNGDMYSSALIIRSAGSMRRMKLDITVNYETNIKRAKEIIEKVLIKIDGVENEPQPKVYVTDLGSDGVKISIYFWVDTDQNSAIGVRDEIATEIKDSLSREKIELFPRTT